MCCRYSGGSKDILCVREDAWSDKWRQRLRRHQFNAVTKSLFKQIAEIDEPLEGLCAGSELDEQIDVAVGQCRAVQHSTEEREPHHPECPNLSFDRAKSRLYVFAGQPRRIHGRQCTRSGNSANCSPRGLPAGFHRAVKRGPSDAAASAASP